MKTFSIRSALTYGFSTTLSHIPFFLGACALGLLVLFTGIFVFIGVNWPTISFLITRVPEQCNFIFAGAEPTATTMQGCLTVIFDFFAQHWVLYSSLLALGFIALLFIFMYGMLGWLNSLLYIYDYHQSSFRALFVSWRLLIPFFIASILYSLIVTCGFVLLIIPGIIFSIGFGFFGLVLVDKKVNALPSLRISWHILRGAKWKFFLLTLCIGILSSIVSFAVGIFPGLITSIIGTLLRVYLYISTSLASVYVYRTLNAQTEVPATLR